MTDYTDRLKNLDDHKLIDVVKNYRQYGYNLELRNSAVSILNSRGISNEDLQLTGNLENTNYNHSLTLFKSYNKNSKLVFILFIVALVTSILSQISLANSGTTGTILTLIYLISILGYLMFLIKSFLIQNRFFNVINQKYTNEAVLIYFFLGIPFYIFMYFYFKNQMKDKMKDIR